MNSTKIEQKPHPLNLLFCSFLFYLCLLSNTQFEDLFYLISLLFLAVILLEIRLRSPLTNTLRFWPALAITFGMHYYVTAHSTAIKTLYPTHYISFAAVSKSIFFTLRVWVFVFVSYLLGSLYTPQIFAQELCKALNFSSFFRKQLNQIEMMIYLSLRFIPFIKNEHHRIILALKARGIVIQKSGIKQQIKFYRKALYPLFLSVFRRSESMANALHARGFDPNSVRTYYHHYPWGKREFMFSLAFSFLCIFSLYM